MPAICNICHIYQHPPMFATLCKHEKTCTNSLCTKLHAASSHNKERVLGLKPLLQRRAVVGIPSWAAISAEWICGGFFELKSFSDFSKAKFANPNPRAPCFSEFLDPLSWCGCRGCVLLRSILLVLAWWWFAGWIWVSAVFRLAWRVSSARMVFGKLLVLPGAPTA